VECKLEEELVDRIDRVAELLKTNRTDIIRSACREFLKKER
jgi:metal-responsive CopG/Arc/MetJ family transcriptional regulator